MELKLTRDVTRKECSWLKKDIKEGTIVHKFYGVTYECISPDGIAATSIKDKHPFFELPRNSVIENKKENVNVN